MTPSSNGTSQYKTVDRFESWFSNQMYDSLPCGVVFQNAYLNIEFANPKAEKLLGLGRFLYGERKTASDLWEVYDTAGNQLRAEQLPSHQALANRKVQQNAVIRIYIIAQNRSTWVKVHAEPCFNETTGELTGVVSFFTDVTEERNIKAALQIITDRSQLAIESASMGVWEWHPKDALMIWDAKMFSLYGCGANTTITPKEAYLRAIHPEDKTEVDLCVRRLLRGSQTSLNYRVIWSDGSLHHLRSHAKVIPNPMRKGVRVVGVTRDVTNEVLAESKLRSLAYKDDLTQTLNRAGVRYHLDGHFEKTNRLGLIAIGLDRFKEINDNLGHAVGDELLQEIVRRIARVVSSEVELGRLGGDEFALIYPSVLEIETLKARAESIVRILSTPFYLDTGPVVSVSASAGVAVSPNDATNPAELIRAVDIAMNQAKANGGNQAVCFENRFREQMNRRFNLRRQLREASAFEEFMLYYQPIVDLPGGKVVGCEALIRWKDEDGNFVSPVEFIPVAEESGLIYSIGKWTCKTAIIQWKLWQKLVSDLQYVSVNVSPVQLRQPTFVDELIELTEVHEVSPSNIQLEITEGTFLQESIQSNSALSQLAGHGFKLAIDDFGTGYSSLAYLKRFAVDTVKIDRSFISDIEIDQSDRDIVGAIIAMNDKLGLKTLVEGVETNQQSEIVQHLGCFSAQGYYFGKPTFADEFAEKYLSNYVVDIKPFVNKVNSGQNKPND